MCVSADITCLLVKSCGAATVAGAEMMMGSCRNPRQLPFTKQELTIALQHLPPLLTIPEAAKLTRRSVSAFRRLIYRGVLRKSVCRGKPTLIWRDMLLVELFSASVGNAL